jgi:hypothetical protein
MPVPLSDKLAADLAPIIVGAGSAFGSYHDWWELMGRINGFVVGAATLVYVVFRAANEIKKWRGRRQEPD